MSRRELRRFGLFAASMAAFAILVPIVSAAIEDPASSPVKAPRQLSTSVRFNNPASAAAGLRSGGAGRRVIYPVGHYPSLTLPDGQRRQVRSLLKVAQPLRFGGYVWDDAGVPQGPVWIRVDLGLQTLSVFRAGHEIGSAVILYGADGKPTPPGVYPVLERAARHRSSLYDAPMPYMLRLTPDGVAIHASKVRASAATHGCIGVPEAFARRLFSQVRRGDTVAVVGMAPPKASTR